MKQAAIARIDFRRRLIREYFLNASLLALAVQSAADAVALERLVHQLKLAADTGKPGRRLR